MRNKRVYKGLTLLEMMVATLLVVLIVSMVYASYSAAARSFGVYTHRLSATHQAHLALQQIASLIQGSFVPQNIPDPNGTAPPVPYTPSQGLRQDRFHNRIPFQVNSHIPYQGLLQVLTTRALVDLPYENTRVFESILRYDRSTHTLLLGQRSWPGAMEGREQAWTWESLLSQVESIQITVFDGQRWYRAWDIRKHRGLPRALTVHVTITDDQGTCFDFERTTSLILDIPEKTSREQKTKDDNLFLYETLDI